MMQFSGEKWFVLLCDKGLNVLETISLKNLNIALTPGVLVTEIIERNNLFKFFDFIVELKKEKAGFSKEILVVDEKGINVVMKFGGVEYRDNFIIAGFSDYFELYEELMSINNEMTNTLRTKMKSSILPFNHLQQMASLNNELINTKRELLKKNSEISELLEKTNRMNNELEESNATKDKLFSILAHDLRSPVASVVDLMRLIANSSETYEELLSANIFSLTLKSCENTLELLNGLFEWSMCKRGQISYNPEAFDIRDLVYETIELMSGTAENKNIPLKSEIEENQLVFADRRMISTVLRNLISNAIKFTNESGEIKVRVSKDMDLCKVSVIDNGVGIPQEKLKMLFFIGKNVTTLGTKGEKGTGIGLNLCKELIERNNGRISVASGEGIGTEFNFFIPVYKMESINN